MLRQRHEHCGARETWLKGARQDALTEAYIPKRNTSGEHDLDRPPGTWILPPDHVAPTEFCHRQMTSGICFLPTCPAHHASEV